MIRNYFIVACRNLIRQKGYTTLNLLGLTLGITVSMIIFIMIRFELSFDNFHASTEKIHRVVRHTSTPDGVMTDTGVPFSLGKAIRDESSGAEKVSMMSRNNDVTVTSLDENQKETGMKAKEVIEYMEPEFFSIFNFPWIAGSPKILADPNAIAMTETMAAKYFGSWQNAMNKYVKLDVDNNIHKIGGILEDIPANSDFPLGIVLSYKKLGEEAPDWTTTHSSTNCYVVLSPASTNDFNNFLLQLGKKNLPPESTDSYVLQAMTTVHFDSDYGNYNDRTVEIGMLRVMGLIGIFILLISCINFVNMALSMRYQRSKEIGIRKALGGSRSHLVWLQLFETGILTFVSLLLALIVSESVLPVVNPLINLPSQIIWWNDPMLVVFMTGVLLLVTILSGIYPALKTSLIKPAAALKEAAAENTGGFSLRKVLIVAQFVVAQGLIFCMFVISGQTGYFMNTSLGFNKDAIVSINIPSDSTSRTLRESLRNTLNTMPEVRNVSYSYRTPALRNGNWWTTFKYNQNMEQTPIFANMKFAEPQYFETFGLELIAGRMYEPSDTVRELVVNEQLLKEAGEKDIQAALSKTLNFWGRDYKIVGVVRDYHVYSLRNSMIAVIMSTNSAEYYRLNVSLDPSHLSDGLEKIKKTFGETYPDQLFEYAFVDDTVAAFYQQERKFSSLFKIFAGIAILIGCLGLFGLVSLSVVRRTKEIGIRKVLGASLSSVVVLLSREFLLLVALASFVAMPVGWMFMRDWLAGFEYKIDISWTFFAASILSSMVIAWIALSFQAIKAALANPVNSLRNS